MQRAEFDVDSVKQPKNKKIAKRCWLHLAIGTGSILGPYWAAYGAVSVSVIGQPR